MICMQWYYYLFFVCATVMLSTAFNIVQIRASYRRGFKEGSSK